MSSALEFIPLDKPFNIYDNGHTVATAAAAAMLALSTICVTVRFLGRFLIKATWAWDDTLILVAFVLVSSNNILVMWAVKHGGAGSHVLLIGFDKLRVFLKVMFTFELIFLAGLAWTRFAVIALYYRLFKISTWVRRTLLAMIVLNAMWWITTEMFVVFTCTPVWSFWIWEKQESCLSVPVFFSAICITNIILDVGVILMPIMVLRGLNMPLRKKIALGGLFGFSLLIPVISGFRLNEMLFAVKINVLRTDPSFSMTGTAIWCMIESSVGVSVACVPSMRPVFRWLTGKPVVPPVNKPSLVKPAKRPPRGPLSTDLSSTKMTLSVLVEEKGVFDSTISSPKVWTSASEETDLDSKGIVVSHEVEMHSNRMSPV